MGVVYTWIQCWMGVVYTSFRCWMGVVYTSFWCWMMVTHYRCCPGACWTSAGSEWDIRLNILLQRILGDQDAAQLDGRPGMYVHVRVRSTWRSCLRVGSSVRSMDDRPQLSLLNLVWPQPIDTLTYPKPLCTCAPYIRVLCLYIYTYIVADLLSRWVSFCLYHLYDADELIISIQILQWFYSSTLCDKLPGRSSSA